MPCPSVSQLYEYLDGECSEDTRLKIERHIAGCSLCQKETSGLRAVIGVVSQVCSTEAPVDICRSYHFADVSDVRRIRQRLAERRRTFFGLAFTPRAVGAAALVLVAFVFGLLAAGPLHLPVRIADSMEIRDLSGAALVSSPFDDIENSEALTRNLIQYHMDQADRTHLVFAPEIIGVSYNP